MSKIVAICQSNYIPWKGYFDMINMADVFVLYDDVQYTKNDWRNRNMIKTSEGLSWLTIPVNYKFKHHETQKINQTKVLDTRWAKKHWLAISHNYAKSKYFSLYKNELEELYLVQFSSLNMLSEINFKLIEKICSLLSIKTKIMWSDDCNVSGDRVSRLLNICNKCKASTYLSGPAAKDYLDIDLFEESGVEVQWMNYSDYALYDQQHGCFEHGVSILDLLFNCGPYSKDYMKSFVEFG